MEVEVQRSEEKMGHCRRRWRGMGERGRGWRWREGKKRAPTGETGVGDDPPSGEGSGWRWRREERRRRRTVCVKVNG